MSSGSSNIRLLNTTISTNTANWGGALFVDHMSSTANLWIVNSTIAENEANSLAGAIYLYTASAGLRTRLHNTIVAENVDGGTADNIYGTLNSTSSYNLIGFEGTGGLSGSTNILLTSGQSAGLAPLGNNGGPTMTHALLSTSLAIDAADNARATAFELLEDQRGYERIVDWQDDDLSDLVDIGAFELGVFESYE